MRILKDENLLASPINAAFAYAWAALSGSWKNSVLIAIALLLLSLGSMVPLVGLVASIVQGIVLYALAYWVVDRLRESPDVAAFREKMTTEDVKTAMFGFFGPAAGFYVGFMVFSLIMMLITLGILWLTGGFAAISVAAEQIQANPDANPDQVAAMYAQMIGAGTPALLFMLVTSLFFSYIWPLVYGYALMQKSFGDAFNAVFMLFSTRFWKAAFTGAYFKLVTLWMLVVFGVGILMAISFGTLILFPLGVLILMWMVYFTAVVAAEAYNLSGDI
ncbi:hypothetical protein [Hydrogenimonas sp.]